MSSGVGTIANYTLVEQVGEGAYGCVYRAQDKRNNELVALKRLVFSKESRGFPLNAVREIKFLRSLQHKNIVKLKDIATSKCAESLELKIPEKDNKDNKNNKDNKDNKKKDKNINISQYCGNLYLVFEYIEHDLGGLVDSKYKFSIPEVKCIMKQMFEVLDYLNEKKIIHRDIKSSNILLSNNHQVKLADFGLARSSISADGREGRFDLTNNVITMWYKPPELLLGAVRYTNAIDVWSTGCVLAELELGRPLFPGNNENKQLELIFRGIGSPVISSWNELNELPNYETMYKLLPMFDTSIRDEYNRLLSDQAINLLERILVADPAKRSSAKIALASTYVITAPDPIDIEPLSGLMGQSFHEYQIKMKRKQQELRKSINDDFAHKVC